MKKIIAFVLLAATGAGAEAQIHLNFDLPNDGQPPGNPLYINSYYAGGHDSYGDTGTNYGITFGNFGQNVGSGFTTLNYPAVNSLLGDNGSVGNEPDGGQYLAFDNLGYTPIYVAGGFYSVTFYYSAPYGSFNGDTVTVSKVRGGSLLGSKYLGTTPDTTQSPYDLPYAYGAWQQVTMTFNQKANYLDLIGGNALLIGSGAYGYIFSDITFDTSPTPEPGTMVLAGLGAAGLLTFRRRH